MRRCVPAILLLLLALLVPTGRSGRLAAQEIIQKVRYQGGHAAWGEKEIRGAMAIGDTSLTFQDEDGTQGLTIPLRKVTDIGSQTQRKEASVGSKLLFGGLARSRQEEFLTITYDGTNDAEAVVFRFEPKTSANALAKIKFRLRKLGVAAASTEAPPPVTNPQR
jgi:hypothetical protein